MDTQDRQGHAPPSCKARACSANSLSSPSSCRSAANSAAPWPRELTFASQASGCCLPTNTVCTSAFGARFAPRDRLPLGDVRPASRRGSRRSRYPGSISSGSSVTHPSLLPLSSGSSPYLLRPLSPTARCDRRALRRPERCESNQRVRSSSASPSSRVDPLRCSCSYCSCAVWLRIICTKCFASCAAAARAASRRAASCHRFAVGQRAYVLRSPTCLCSGVRGASSCEARTGTGNLAHLLLLHQLLSPRSGALKGRLPHRIHAAVSRRRHTMPWSGWWYSRWRIAPAREPNSAAGTLRRDNGAS
jgi:hypothetical protein